MKEEYESLDMDVIEFDTEDVITTSCTLFSYCDNETEIG